MDKIQVRLRGKPDGGRLLLKQYLQLFIVRCDKLNQDKGFYGLQKGKNDTKES
jgi:hypothetical protein